MVPGSLGARGGISTALSRAGGAGACLAGSSSGTPCRHRAACSTVLLSVAVVASGKTLSVRQLVGVTRLRAEGLLSALSKLVDSGRAHAFVETQSVRCLRPAREGIWPRVGCPRGLRRLHSSDSVALRASFGKGGLRGSSRRGDSPGTGGLLGGRRRPLEGSTPPQGGDGSSPSASSRSLPGTQRSPAGEAKWKGPPVAIIGGGLSGLACGWALKQRGVRAVVFDTGKRGPGGRASSRVLKGGGGTHVVDHAVQAFTAEAPEVRSLVAEMERAGVVQSWNGLVGTLEPGGRFRPREEAAEGPLWIGNQAEGMGAVSSWLARNQVVQQDVWVARLAKPKNGSGAWELQDRNRKQIGNDTYSYVVMAHNGKCADRLIKTTPDRTDAHAPLRCKFTPTPSASETDLLELSSLWVCVVAVPAGVADFDGAFVEGNEVLSWAGNNASKYPAASGSSGVEAWTLISTPRFGTANKCAQEFIPADVRQKVSDEMRAAFGALVGTNASNWEVLHLQLWGAALPLNTCQQHFIHDPVAKVGICGDWLTSPSVEGALFSGLALAGAIEKELADGGMPATGVQPFRAVTGGHAIGAFGTGSASLTVDEVVESAKEAAEAAAAAGADERKWNFAFGANINPWKLRTRRGIIPVEQVAGYLPGWRLVFNHSGGMGNIEPLPQESLEDGTPDAVHGMLLLLEKQDFDKLSAMEHEYRTEEVVVKAYDGRSITALAYVSPPDYKLQNYPPPPERYINLIRRGASESRLDQGYQQWLRTIDGVEDRGPEYWDHPGFSRRKQQQQQQQQQRRR